MSERKVIGSSLRTISILLFCLLIINFGWMIFNRSYFLLIGFFFFYLVIFLFLNNQFQKHFSQKSNFQIFPFLILSMIIGQKIDLFFVSNWQIHWNFFLRKKRPSPSLLNVDSRSIVVGKQEDGFCFFQPGLQVINKKDQIRYVLKEGLDTISQGPLDDEEISENRFDHENLTDYHLRKTRLDSSKSITKDNITLYSSLLIFYSINFDQNPELRQKQLMSLAKSLSEISIAGNTKETIEKTIGDFIIGIWCNYVRSHIFDEINEQFSKRIYFLNEILAINPKNSVLNSDAIHLAVFLEGIYKKPLSNNLYNQQNYSS